MKHFLPAYCCFFVKKIRRVRKYTWINYFRELLPEKETSQITDAPFILGTLIVFGKNHFSDSCFFFLNTTYMFLDKTDFTFKLLSFLSRKTFLVSKFFPDTTFEYRYQDRYTMTTVYRWTKYVLSYIFVFRGIVLQPRPNILFYTFFSCYLFRIFHELFTFAPK